MSCLASVAKWSSAYVWNFGAEAELGLVALSASIANLKVFASRFVRADLRLKAVFPETVSPTGIFAVHFFVCLS